MRVLEVTIVPNASRTEIVGEHNGRLKIRIQQPATDGKANAALIKLLAKEYGISKSRITIVRGHTARQKTLHLL